MAILLSNDLRKRQDEATRNNLLLYQQIFVYLFAFYAIWGSVLTPHILNADWLNLEIRERLTAIVVVLAIPFQLFSWWFLLRLFMEPQPIKHPIFAATSVLFGVFAMALLIVLYVFPVSNLLEAATRLYCITHLLVSLLAAAMFISSPGKQFTPKVSRWWAPFIVLFGSIQAVGTAFYHLSLITSLLFIVLFFISNLWPVVLFWFYAKKQLPSNENHDAACDALMEKYQISKRESEIIRRICQGKTNQEIANELFITLQTVKDHTSRIYLKTSVKNRTQLSNLFGGEVNNQAE